MADGIVVARDGHFATVTISRPERRNALDLAAWRALAEAFAELDQEDDVRCVVVRGAGRTAFAAGADISAFSIERTWDKSRAYGEAEMAGVNGVADCRHPTVALIYGACVGGGLEIAAACDTRICGVSSRFGVPINRLGLTMAHDELAFFIEAVGRSTAMELLLEGSVVDSAHALELGLVSRVVADDDVEAEAWATAARVAAGAPLVNRWHKKFARRLRDPTPLTEEERAEGYAAFETEDYRIGFQAFLNKTKPSFGGS